MDGYTIWKVLLNTSYFVSTFMFENKVLKIIDFILDEKLIVAGSRDNRSRENELKKKVYFENWLTKEPGQARQFSWGNAGAFFNRHGDLVVLV